MILSWALQLEKLTAQLPLCNPKKGNEEILKEIVCKLFNAKGNSILKRYFSTYLARGGKKASQSSSRELRKHEGLGKKEVKKGKI